MKVNINIKEIKSLPQKLKYRHYILIDKSFKKDIVILTTEMEMERDFIKYSGIDLSDGSEMSSAFVFGKDKIGLYAIKRIDDQK